MVRPAHDIVVSVIWHWYGFNGNIFYTFQNSFRSSSTRKDGERNNPLPFLVKIEWLFSITGRA